MWIDIRLYYLMVFMFGLFAGVYGVINVDVFSLFIAGLSALFFAVEFYTRVKRKRAMQIMSEYAEELSQVGSEQEG